MCFFPGGKNLSVMFFNTTASLLIRFPAFPLLSHGLLLPPTVYQWNRNGGKSF